MDAYQHKIILEEVLKTKAAIDLIDSPKLKTFILKRVLEDLKWRHGEKSYSREAGLK